MVLCSYYAGALERKTEVRKPKRKYYQELLKLEAPRSNPRWSSSSYNVVLMDTSWSPINTAHLSWWQCPIKPYTCILDKEVSDS